MGCRHPKDKSKGHVCFTACYEFFVDPEGTLFKAPIDRPFYRNGYRAGARFECEPRSDGHREYLRTAWGVTIEEN
jgi:hypothetical protein